MAVMAQKSEKMVGNTWVLVCNSFFWNEIQNTLAAYLRDYKVDGAYVWSKGANDYIKVGATYNAYTFGGNTLIIQPERALDVEFPTRKFALITDFSADKKQGRAAVEFVTFKGGEMIHNVVTGVGGKTGLAGGEVASPVAGCKHIMFGLKKYNS